MARTPVQPKKAVLAAATQINIDSHDEVRHTLSQREDWQRVALDFYDSIGQLKHAGSLVADVMARVHFYVAEKADPNETPQPTNNADATAPLDRLRDFSDGLAEIQREATLHYLVPGECYLIGLGPRDERGKPTREEGRERWFIASIDEVEHKSGRVIVKHPDTGKAVELVGKDAAEKQSVDPDFWCRMWRRHIRYGWKPDSPFRGILSDAEDYTLFGKLLRAASRTRLLFAGLLKVPDDLELKTANPTEGDDSEDPEQDPFFAKLMEAMMAAMDEKSMSSVAPLLLRGAGEALDQVDSLIFERPMDALLETLRKDSLDHIAQGLPLPVEFVFGLGEANHWGCITPDVEILTRSGWKTHDELAMGEEALTLNHETGLSEWKPVQRINVFNVENEEMIRLDQRFHRSLTTPNHNWPTLEPLTEPTEAGGRRIVGFDRCWSTSEELTTTSRVPLAVPHADIPTTAKWEDAFVELMAWYYTEGTIRFGKNVIIGQSHKANPAHCARIYRTLTALYGPEHEGNIPTHPATPPAWRAFKEDRGMTIFSLNKAASKPFIEVAPDKVVPRSFISDLTLAQLELFLLVSAWGDGQAKRNGSLTLNQRRLDRLEAFEMAAVLTGRRTAVYEANKGTDPQRFGTSVHWEVGASTDVDQFKPAQIKREPYTGIVWCPTIENATWFARSEGRTFYTGNSGQIEESAFQLYFDPIATWLANSLTSGFLLPELRANEVENPEQYRIWFDATALTRSSEKKDVAIDAYKEGLLSGERALEALGYDKDDAPDDAEKEERREEMRLRSREREPLASRTEPMTAAAMDPDLGQQLAEIDSELRARLEGATDAAMQRALEKAGNRIITVAHKDRALKASLNGTTAEEVGKQLGRTVVASLVNVNDILDGAWTKLGDRFDSWGAEAVNKSLDLIQMDDIERQEATSSLAIARNEAWKWLEGQLNESAVQILYGEQDEVPFAVIREAVARAGLV